MSSHCFGEYLPDDTSPNIDNHESQQHGRSVARCVHGAVFIDSVDAIPYMILRTIERGAMIALFVIFESENDFEGHGIR